MLGVTVNERQNLSITEISALRPILYTGHKKLGVLLQIFEGRNVRAREIGVHVYEVQGAWR